MNRISPQATCHLHNVKILCVISPQSCQLDPGTRRSFLSVVGFALLIILKIKVRGPGNFPDVITKRSSSLLTRSFLGIYVFIVIDNRTVSNCASLSVGQSAQYVKTSDH